MTCFGYSSIKIDKYSNSTAIDRGKVKFIFTMVGRTVVRVRVFQDSPKSGSENIKWVRTLNSFLSPPNSDISQNNKKTKLKILF